MIAAPSETLNADSSPQTAEPTTVSVPIASFEMPALFFAAASEAAPALVLLHDIYGWDEAAHHTAKRLNTLGYTVLMPDLFARNAAPPDADETALSNYVSDLSDPVVIRDALAALDFLVTQAGVDATRMGLIGWGWGGAHALMAASYDERARVVIDIGGELTYPVLTAEKPGSPLNFVADIQGVIFGAFAGQDPMFPALEIGRLRARIVEHDKTGEIKIYEAPARFWRDEQLPQTRAFWRRLENFLDTNLKNPGESDEPLGDYPNEASRLQA